MGSPGYRVDFRSCPRELFRVTKALGLSAAVSSVAEGLATGLRPDEKRQRNRHLCRVGCSASREAG